MRLRSLTAAVLLAAACAPAAVGAPDAGPPASIRGDATSLHFSLSADDAAITASLPAGPGAVWRELVQVFGELGIPIGTMDEPRGTIGNADLRVSRRLAGRSMSVYLDCGRGATGPLANSYDVSISLLARVTPTETGETVVSTELGASAVNNEGSSAQPVRCSSTGEMEQRIVRLLRERLAS